VLAVASIPEAFFFVFSRFAPALRTAKSSCNHIGQMNGEDWAIFDASFDVFLIVKQIVKLCRCFVLLNKRLFIRSQSLACGV
jgi:hypothetical protein